MPKTRPFVPTNLEDLVYGFDDAPNLLPAAEALDVWRPALERQLSEAQSNLLALRSIANSPIEERFLAAVWALDGWGWTRRLAINAEGLEVAWATDATCDGHLQIQAQAPVGPYKTDFLLTGVRKQKVSLAIELDGHDFHEKTKQQAAHDKKRDRFFAAEHVPFLRFTGSEIYRDAKACANEALALLSSLQRRKQEP